jgi:hypothetical protein
MCWNSSLAGNSHFDKPIYRSTAPRKTPGPRPRHRPPSFRQEGLAFRHEVKRNSVSAAIPASFAPCGWKIGATASILLLNGACQA